MKTFNYTLLFMLCALFASCSDDDNEANIPLADFLYQTAWEGTENDGHTTKEIVLEFVSEEKLIFTYKKNVYSNIYYYSATDKILVIKGPESSSREDYWFVTERNSKNMVLKSDRLNTTLTLHKKY